MSSSMLLSTSPLNADSHRPASSTHVSSSVVSPHTRDKSTTSGPRAAAPTQWTQILAMHVQYSESTTVCICSRANVAIYCVRYAAFSSSLFIFHRSLPPGRQVHRCMPTATPRSRSAALAISAPSPVLPPALTLRPQCVHQLIRLHQCLRAHPRIDGAARKRISVGHKQSARDGGTRRLARYEPSSPSFSLPIPFPLSFPFPSLPLVLPHPVFALNPHPNRTRTLSGNSARVPHAARGGDSARTHVHARKTRRQRIEHVSGMRLDASETLASSGRTDARCLESATADVELASGAEESHAISLPFPLPSHHRSLPIPPPSSLHHPPSPSPSPSTHRNCCCTLSPNSLFSLARTHANPHPQIIRNDARVGSAPTAHRNEEGGRRSICVDGSLREVRWSARTRRGTHPMPFLVLVPLLFPLLFFSLSLPSPPFPSDSPSRSPPRFARTARMRTHPAHRARWMCAGTHTRRGAARSMWAETRMRRGAAREHEPTATCYLRVALPRGARALVLARCSMLHANRLRRRAPSHRCPCCVSHPSRGAGPGTSHPARRVPARCACDSRDYVPTYLSI
ncbi:hypothetical protein DFH06DRAFT_1488884 [Mycena polygramma]|nr:hypothetical protein DFH06DRAFT_1488884 [Mycena polygramma]